MQLAVTALRFALSTSRPLGVPQEKYANVVRGALGLSLRQISCRPDCSHSECNYGRLFEPRGGTPSGFSAAPRPFVLRVQPTAGGLTVGMNLLGSAARFSPLVSTAIDRMCSEGLGPGRVPATLMGAEWLDENSQCHPFLTVEGESPGTLTLPLKPAAKAPNHIRIHFRTPTALKVDGEVTRHAQFSALFHRLRDRILYIAAPGEDYSALALDLAQRAAAVEQTGESLTMVTTERMSTKTGQHHQIGGFIGHADYTGAFEHLWPWMLAAAWTGVGRHTVWGNGHIQCEALPVT